MSPIRMLQMWPQLDVPLIEQYQEDQQSKFCKSKLGLGKLRGSFLEKKNIFRFDQPVN